MKSSIYNILAVLTVLIGGCTKQLEIAPVSSITNASYWQAEGDVTGYLTGIYTDFRGLMNSTYFYEDRGDAFVVGLEGSASDAWEQNLNDANAPSWLNHYNLVHHCNLLLKYGSQIEFADQNRKNRVLAEAYFMRAFVYFQLTKAWGDVPIVLEPTESDEEFLPSRSPAAEVIATILNDVNQAIGLFPEDGFPNKNRASKPVANALKAEVLLWNAKVLQGGQADLEEALTAINASMPGLSLLNDFSQIFSTDNRRNGEVAWAIHFMRDERSDQYGSRMKPRNIFVSGAVNEDDLPYALNGARSVYAPSPKIQAAFDENPNDTRKASSVIRAIDGANGSLIGTFDNKFRGTAFPDDRYYDNDIIIYRLGGLLLTKAEILAALNRTEEAISELEKIRERAGTGAYTGSRDKNSVEREILEEQFREQYFELKRWNDLVRYHYAGTIDIYDEVPNLNGTELPLFFPIRRTQIDLNNNLEQTDGY